MKRVLLVTGHVLASKRRAGFHWLADAFWRAGWEVVFLTTGVSWPLWLRRHDYRTDYPLAHEANRLRWQEPRLGSFVWMTPFHPTPTGSARLDRWLAPLFRRYGSLPLGTLASIVRQTDLFVFESAPGLLLAERFRRLNPGARFVYRVSDDMRLLGYHPVVRDAEVRMAQHFDLISVPSRSVLARLAPLGRAVFQPQGIRKDLFDAAGPSPYTRPGPHLVFVGNSHFDADFVERASRLFPAWSLHVIGPVGGFPERPNVVAYGELPFLETVPFIRHADIGLNARSWGEGVECLVDSSLKVLQYTYCRLPIVSPDFLPSERPHVLCYRPGDDESIRSALLQAAAYDRASIVTDDICTWDEIADAIAGPLAAPAASATTPPAEATSPAASPASVTAVAR